METYDFRKTPRGRDFPSHLKLSLARILALSGLIKCGDAEPQPSRHIVSCGGANTMSIHHARRAAHIKLTLAILTVFIVPSGDSCEHINQPPTPLSIVMTFLVIHQRRLEAVFKGDINTKLI